MRRPLPQPGAPIPISENFVNDAPHLVDYMSARVMQELVAAENTAVSTIRSTEVTMTEDDMQEAVRKKCLLDGVVYVVMGDSKVKVAV